MYSNTNVNVQLVNVQFPTMMSTIVTTSVVTVTGATFGKSSGGSTTLRFGLWITTPYGGDVLFTSDSKLAGSPEWYTSSGTNANNSAPPTIAVEIAAMLVALGKSSHEPA